MGVFGFDTADVDTSSDLFPAGEHKVIATEAAVEKNKAGTGQYLKLTLQVIDGRFQNRLHWQYHNFLHQNETAQKIGQQQVAQFQEAIGVNDPESVSELCNKPLLMVIRHRIDKRTNEERAEVAQYKPLRTTPAAAVSQTPGMTPEPVPSAADSSPWAE